MSGRPRRRNAEVLAGLLDWRGRRVLDAGCGRGALLAWLVRRGARPVGLDPDAEALRAARARLPEVPLVAGRGEALPLAGGRFDLVVWFNALHHVPVVAMARALTESLRVLAEGGRLLVVEPLAEGPWFEVMRPLEDESDVRAAAAGAVDALVAVRRARRLRREEWCDPARLDGFAELRRRLLAADPARAARIAGVEAELARRFAERAEPQPDGGFVLAQPMRLDLLAPV